MWNKLIEKFYDPGTVIWLLFSVQTKHSQASLSFTLDLLTELKDSLSRVGADIKQKIIDSVKSTWKSINDFAMAHRTTPQQMIESEVDNVLHQMTQQEEEAETGCG